jgi:TFIIF-interacting CTD phosphatase-like protein
MAIRLLVLDLDETLIYTTETPLSRDPHWTFNEYSIYRRPYLDAFLAYCQANFDLGVWSSAGDEYVAFVAQKLFPDPSSLKFVWGGSRCIHRSSGITNIKDLRKLQRFKYLPHEILIVDDSAEKVSRQPKNLVLIPPYAGDPEDNELSSVIELIEARRSQFEKPLT